MLRKIECYLKPSGLDGLRGLAIKMGIEKKMDMRTASYMLAVSRVAEAHVLRGLYP